MNIIAHNLIAMNAQRYFGIHSNSKCKLTEKLSSGYRINKASDDAASLSISEKMRRQIRGLSQASENIMDGISFVQVADGALNEVQEILQRMNELAIKAANGTNSYTEREFIQQEISQLSKGCDRIFKDTEFNTHNIWQASYVPYVTGIPRELKIYNETIDMRGEVSYGGIIWASKRYSWDEIDSNMYDDDTGKFVPGLYTIDVPAVEFDISKDEYVENGNSVTLKINVSEGGLLTSISRECSWSANEDGITMDGVLYKWMDMENMNHDKQFNPYQIEAGYWGFNTYNGTHIWFEIPDGADNLTDVIEGINGTLLDNLLWETQISSIGTNYAVGIIYGNHLGVYEVPIIKITNATKNLVSDKYYLHADESGVWVENEDGTNLGKETWKQLGLINNAGEFLPIHEYSNHSYYDFPLVLDQPDSHYAVIGGSWQYTSGDEGYNSKSIPGLDIQFMILEEASKQAVINGIDGVIIQADIETPSKATATVGNTSRKVSFDSASADLSFEFHKDIGRNFNTASASLGNGSITYDANGEISLSVTNSGKNKKFTALNSYEAIENRVKVLLNGKGGNLLLKFQDSSGNKVELNYAVSGLTADERQAILAGNASLDNYSNAVLTDIFKGKVSLFADGHAEQSLGYERGSMSASGWANTNNNKASYVDFDTKIRYTRQLDIQAGGEAEEIISIKYNVLNSSILGLVNVSVLDEYSAGVSIECIKKAMQTVNGQRSAFGAYQNRLEKAYEINENTAENTAAAESIIRDADMSKEIMNSSLRNMMMQAGQIMLAQANQTGKGVLTLLE